MWTTTDYDRPQQRVACRGRVLRASCATVRWSFVDRLGVDHRFHNFASLTVSVSSMRPLRRQLVHQLRHSFSLSSRFGSDTASILLNSRSCSISCRSDRIV
jgi:hypothetical protein